MTNPARFAFLIVAASMWLGCQNTIDPKKLETSITDGLKANNIPMKSVTCPQRNAKAGDTFNCEGVSADGDKLTIRIDQKDDQGNVGWKVENVVPAKGEATKGKPEGETPKAEAEAPK